ncbi:MAG: ATP-dependent helicase [Desulfatibacillaceae bacterium]
MGRIDYEAELNPSQYEAVITVDGAVLVIAGAGTGKTRTLTYRVANLVESGVAPYSILLLTFTRKAAGEMIERASNLLDERCGNVSGGTFHSFAHMTLRRWAEEIGFSKRFSILDQGDAETLVDRIKAEVVPKSERKGFPRKRTVASIFSKAANKGLSVADVVDMEYSHFNSRADILERMREAYTKRKRDDDLMDFDDLLLHLRDLLAENEEARRAIAGRFSHIMVDEYQDTNHMQADILRYLAGAHGNVMAVGDDCQSIYAFRGANFENIMRFPDEYPGARVIRLEQNYRSTQPILSTGNAIVSQAVRKYSKRLFTEKSGGVAPMLLGFDEENDQSLFIVDEIRRLLQEDVPPGEIAVLFRAGYQAFDLEVELARARIPFVKYGGFKFMDSAHVKDMLAYMKVLAYPSDSLAWTRVLGLLDKVGPKTAENLFRKIEKTGRGHKGLADIKPAPSYREGFEKLAGAFTSMDPDRHSVSQLGMTVLEHYIPYLKEQYDNWPKRVKDLEHLVEMMDRYESLVPFLADMALDPPTTSVDDGLSTGGHEGRLVLSTIHSAKGLEWDTVFVVWALDGRFPAAQSIFKRDDSLEEELRLMYVAATRARERLYFTHPRNVFDRTTNSFLNQPSRFLSCIPKEVLKRTAR